jgi:hypothetical protein
MSTGNRFPVPKTPEERAEYVAAKFESCSREIATYVKQLRCDFRALKSGETIMGCKTWTKFCMKVLKRTTRAVGYIMAGGNPRWKRKPSKEDWKNHWQGMPEFIEDDQTAFKTIHVHFENQEHVDKFAELVGQRITPKTRFIYFPKQKKGSYADKRYADTQREPDDGIASPDSEEAVSL